MRYIVKESLEFDTCFHNLIEIDFRQATQIPSLLPHCSHKKASVKSTCDNIFEALDISRVHLPSSEFNLINSLFIKIAFS